MRILTTILLLSMNSSLMAQYQIDSSLIAAPRPVYDQYFGQTVEDQYQYLENLESPEVQAWFKAQNSHCREVLSNITNQASILDEFKKINERKSASTSFPKVTGERMFYTKTFKQDNKEQLYYRDGMKGKEVLLFDTQQYSKEVKVSSAVIDYFDPSPKGDYVAFGVSTDGSEMATIHILQVDDKEILSEKIERAMYGNPAWLPDESGFFYNQMLPSTENDVDSSSETLHTSKVLLHMLNTSVEQDIEVFSRDLNSSLPIEPIDFPFAVLFPSSKNLFIYIYRGTMDDLAVYKAPLATVLEAKEKKAIAWQSLFTIEDQVTDFAVFEDDLFLLTYKDAPTFKLVQTSTDDVNIEQAITVIDSSKFILEDIYLTGADLYVASTLNGISHFNRVDVKNHSTKAISLPFEGTAFMDSEFFSYGENLFFKIDSWIHPLEVYYYDTRKKETISTSLQPKVSFSITDQLIVEELEIPSHDGTLVPLSIIRHRDAKKDGKNFTVLEGYGAYGFSFNPLFQSQWLPWFEQGGALAVAHVRGGGEKGNAWYQAGLKATKPNSWKDFIACAEYLIDNKYTSKEHLAAYSASAGGIMLGQAITERPDLFQAAAIQVGAMNPLRHEFTKNSANIPEYGTVKDSLEFQYLYNMDPYHHVEKNVPYPAMLFTAGMNDTRLPPWLPGKMVARLQQVTSSDKPILFRIEYEGGHFGGSFSQRDQEWADIFTFFLWQLGHPDFVLDNS